MDPDPDPDPDPDRTADPDRGAAGSLPATGDVETALALARLLGPRAPVPGSGRTAVLWSLLERLARHDLGLARTIEPHLDALAILEQAGLTPASVDLAPDATLGVFAAEGGGEPLIAHRSGARWRLEGVKPWCSLAARLDGALVTAHLEHAGGERGLFAVALRNGSAEALPDSWHARGLAEIPSGPVRFSGAEATPVGEPGWYLSRPGFAWGGIGVAACWLGGALGVARALAEAARRPGRDADPLLLHHLGAVDAALQDARRALDDAADRVDSGRAVGAAGGLLAKRTRSTVWRAAETVLLRTGHALGPAPYVSSPGFAKRTADLELYLRQQHAERDDAALGRAVLSTEADRSW